MLFEELNQGREFPVSADYSEAEFLPRHNDSLQVNLKFLFLECQAYFSILFPEI